MTTIVFADTREEFTGLRGEEEPGGRVYHFVPMAGKHREAVMGIFNHYVANTVAEFPDAPLPSAFFDRMMEMVKGYSAIVAQSGDEEVIGFGMLRPFHFVSTFRRTAELTYFLKPECTRRGIGKAMLNFFVEEARRLGIDNVMASVSSLNPASIAFHLKNGFHECGRFCRVGTKFGLDFDMLWFQRRLAA